jgi:hypothetical protein
MAKKKKSRRKHSVKANLQVMELSKAGTSLELQLFAKDLKLGDLTIGRGSLYWHGRNRQSSKRISWSRFARMMDELAYGK